MSVDVIERQPTKEDLDAILADYEASVTEDDSPKKTDEVPSNGVYYRKTVRRTDALEIASFLFFAGTSTVLHGHTEAAALIKVKEGLLMEEAFIPSYCTDSVTRSPNCTCFTSYPCRFKFQVRAIRGGESGFLPIGAYHRVHCIESGPTFNVYFPRSSNPVAAVPEEIMIKLLTAKHEYISRYNAIIKAPIFDKFGPMGIDSIINCKISDWAEREQYQNSIGATLIHPDTVADFRNTNILGTPIPIEFGGFGDKLSVVTSSIRKLAAVAPATALALAMPLGCAAAATIPPSAIPCQYRDQLHANTAWLVRKVVHEKMILAVANSEPGSGGELKLTTTSAVFRDGRYFLSGSKSFATIGPDADYFMCAAKRVNQGDVVDGFFVAKENVMLDSAWNPLGMRPTASVGLQLNDSPAECMLGFPSSLSGINARHWSTLMFTAVFVGVAEGALKTLCKMLDSKSKQGSYVRSTVANLALQIDAAAGFLESLAGDNSVPYPQAGKERCNNAKSFAAKVAVETATTVSMLSGGRAYKANHMVSQILHDALAAPLLRPPFPKVMDGIASVWLDEDKPEAEL